MKGNDWYIYQLSVCGNVTLDAAWPQSLEIIFNQKKINKYSRLPCGKIPCVLSKLNSWSDICIHLFFWFEGSPLVIMCRVRLVINRRLKKNETNPNWFIINKKEISEIKLLHKHWGHCFLKWIYIWTKWI